MKFITTIALIFLTLPIWAEDRGIRIHQSNLESFCPVRRAWIPIDRHVSDFRSAKNGVAYRAHGKLYFFNYKTGTNHYIEKRVSTYDIADNNAISFVHDRDLYVTTAPGSKRPVRLKGNITSFQFSDNGVLGFVDDGDLYLATNCQSGAVRKLKGNIRSYKIHDNGTFAFVDDGELFIVSDTSNGHIRKLSSRVYDYNFTQNGELFYKDRHGMFKVTNCHTGHVERFSEHRNHNHGYENRGSRHRGHEQSNRFRYNQWKSHNGKQYTFRNNELYVLENNRPKCIARNVRDYKFSGKNITYTTDRSAHLILPEDNWRDINLGDRHSSCRILGNGDIEVHHGKRKYQLCKKLNYKRLPVNDYHSFRDGIIYSHNKQIIFENAHRRNVIANGVDRFHRGKDKIYFCMNKSVFSLMEEIKDAYLRMLSKSIFFPGTEL